MGFRNRGMLAAVLLIAAVAVGCNTMDFEVASTGSVGEEVHDRKAFFLWGLAPTRKVDVCDHCPAGVRSFREETTFGDGLLRAITIGIYSPRTTYYECLRGE